MFKKYKVLVSLIMLLAVFKPLAAQYRFGLSGGVIASNHVGDDFVTTDFPKIGMALGFFYEAEINQTMSLLVEPSFEQKGAVYSFEPRFDTKVNVDSDLDYFTLPLMIKANFSSKPGLGAKSNFGKKNRSRKNPRYRSRVNYYLTGGISLSYLVSSKNEVHTFQNGVEIDSSPFFPYSFSKIDASVSIGGGVMWKEIFIDLRYARGLRSVFEGQNVPEVRNHVVSVKLAYSLYRQKSYYSR